jgi:hypothetical protein
MDILWTILIGLVVGAIAKFVMPGKGPGGFIVTILLYRLIKKKQAKILTSIVLRICLRGIPGGSHRSTNHE